MVRQSVKRVHWGEHHFARGTKEGRCREEGGVCRAASVTGRRPLVRYVCHAQSLSHLKVRYQKRTRAREKVRREREGHAWRHGPEV
jgi:hypothetical protein